jgi:putative flippase GtrA
MRVRAATRFFAVAVTGFLLNETLYWGLLDFGPFSYRIALLIVLATVAVVTFLLSKHWAFKDD